MTSLILHAKKRNPFTDIRDQSPKYLLGTLLIIPAQEYHTKELPCAVPSTAKWPMNGTYLATLCTSGRNSDETFEPPNYGITNVSRNDENRSATVFEMYSIQMLSVVHHLDWTCLRITRDHSLHEYKGRSRKVTIIAPMYYLGILAMVSSGWRRRDAHRRKSIPGSGPRLRRSFAGV